MRSPIILWGALVVVVGGCPDSSSSSETTCALVVSLSGDLQASLTADSSVGCVVPISAESGIEVEYVPTTEGPLERATLVVEAATKGETGADLPATLQIDHSDGRSWRADCTVAIATNEFREAAEFGDRYHVEGHGECGAAATGESGSVTVGSFDFVVHAVWSA